MMDLNANGDSSAQTSCSICLEPVGDQRTRSVARLHCGHDFHLDCIGSAFNAKGMMQCPNCRKVERGQWLYASGPNHNHSSSDDFDWMGDDIYDVTFAELPIGFHWCPIRGFTQITSVIEYSVWVILLVESKMRIIASWGYYCCWHLLIK